MTIPSSVCETSPPSIPKLILHGCQPVGLVTTDVCDPSDPGASIGQQTECRDDWCQLAGCVQVDIDSMQLTAGDAHHIAA